MAGVPGVKEAKAAMALMPDLRQMQKVVSAMQGVVIVRRLGVRDDAARDGRFHAARARLDAGRPVSVLRSPALRAAVLVALAALTAGCVPIGVRVQNMFAWLG